MCQSRIQACHFDCFDAAKIGSFCIIFQEESKTKKIFLFLLRIKEYYSIN